MKSIKEEILNEIKKNRPAGSYDYPTFPVFEERKEGLKDTFEKNLLLAAGNFYDVPDHIEAENLIRQLHPDAKVICSATPEIRGNKNLSQVVLPRDLSDVDVGVIRADFGVAEEGMVWIREKDMGINALGFLSQHLVILLDPEAIVSDLYKAYERVELTKNKYGCFMMGPSATADIGAVMVQGAQGARSLTLFFMKTFT